MPSAITDLAHYRAARQRPITDLAHYRAARQRPITDACAWSSAFESVAATNIKIVFAWQRMWLRAWVR